MSDQTTLTPTAKARVVRHAVGAMTTHHGPQDLYMFHCPGCGNDHGFHVPRWSWNGSFEFPTFSPSLLCNPDEPASRCHSFVVNGQIQFLSDCWHPLAGQTVDLPNWEDRQ